MTDGGQAELTDNWACYRTHVCDLDQWTNITVNRQYSIVYYSSRAWHGMYPASSVPRTAPHPSTSHNATKSVAVSIVGARLDYCNSLLHGTSQRNFDRLQRVQNSLARLVTQAPRRSSATDLRRQLHWLPIRQRVSFKFVTITSRAIHTGTPTYLACELHRHQPLRALRSGTTTTLHRPHAFSDFDKHSFAVSAPATWNNISLPASIRDSATLVTFKTAFKTHLFNSAYTARHWLPSMGASDSLFRDIWRQLKNFMLIDWLIRWLNTEQWACHVVGCHGDRWRVTLYVQVWQCQSGTMYCASLRRLRSCSGSMGESPACSCCRSSSLAYRSSPLPPDYISFSGR